MDLKDSGERRGFESGAVRDISEGKGRCDLLSLDVIGDWLQDPILTNINNFIRTGDEKQIYLVLDRFIELYMKMDLYTALLELSKHYEDGARKYADRNFELGMPLHCYMDSGIRHYLKYRRGDNDEPHDRAFLWNMICGLWTYKNLPDMNDLPFSEVKNET